MTSPAGLVSARDVSVVIPVHRAGEALRRCLARLAAAEPQAGEVIVVADGGGDGQWRDAAEFANVRLIELPERRGAPAARNAAARVANGSVLFFVDADVIVETNAVGEVVAALNERPEWSGVFGSYDDAPGAPNFVAQYKGLLNHYVHQHARDEAFTFWTALGAIRKDVFLQLGGFDVTQRLEDVELGYRLRVAGFRVGVRKTLLGKHLKRWTAWTLVRSDFYDRALPWTELMLRHKHAEKDLNLDTANRLSVVCVFALLASPALAWLSPPAGAGLAVASAGSLLWLNRKLYAFFLFERGPAFLAAAVFWHWLYFLYGGIAFAIGTALHVLRGSRRHATETNPATPPAASQPIGNTTEVAR